MENFRLGRKHYSGTEIGPKWKPGFTKAIYYWVPSIATSAITIYKGEEFEEWNGHALITSLKDQSLRKIEFKNGNLISEKIFLKVILEELEMLKFKKKLVKYSCYQTMVNFGECFK